MNPATPGVPLCVGLDHTLVRTSTLAETIVGVVRWNPAWVFAIPFWAIRGEAYLWARLVERFRPDACLLPYSEPVLGLIRSEAAAGRKVILATSAHERLAQEVAGHLGLFSGVMATNGAEHLAGRRKADALTARFGTKGFDYVGGAAHDVEVFRSRRQAYVASPSPRLAERLERESMQAVWIGSGGRVERWSSLLQAARPKQWVKNALVFLALVLGHRFSDGTALMQSGLASVLMCLASAAVYLFNDIVDVEADRRHPTKRRRPFARGAVSIRLGVVAGIVLATAAVGLGWLVGPQVSLLLT